MIKRHIETKLLQWARQYPVLTVTGPRQAGKTTLCRSLFAKKPYRSLEDPDTRAFARTDPRGFLAEIPAGGVIDEVQHVPELLSYIQTRVDEKQRPGMFILTGSRQFEMMEKVTQSLAGRTAIVRLLPFSFGELYDKPAELPMDRMLYAGFYPRIHDRRLNPTEALSFYVATYLERDVRQILAVTDMARFEIFLRLCAGRTGQLLNMQALGNECGITHNTIKSWLSVLQVSGIITLLRPWHANLNKRMIKSPKLYFLDTGLACFLLGIQKPEHLTGHPLRGALFETFVVSEACKQQNNAGRTDPMGFFRDSNGNEVDLLIGAGAELEIWEAKSAMTVASDFFNGMDALERALGPIKSRSIVYGGDKSMTRQETHVIPWRDIGGIFVS